MTDKKCKENLVSIVMPTHNSEKLVRESIESILNQSYQNWELNVVDDASNDNTLNILKEFEKQDDRIKVTANKINSGAAVTRNVSINKATGQYIAFLDSDDIWEIDKLKLQLSFMKSINASISFTAYKVINEEGEESGQLVDTKATGTYDYSDMLAKKATFGCSTVILDQCLVGKMQMPLLRTGQDYAYWLSILKTGHCAYAFNQALTRYRIVPGSISRNKVRKAMRKWEIYRRIEKINVFLSSWYFLNYAWRAVFRK